MASCCTSVLSVAVSAVLASASACAKAGWADGIAAKHRPNKTIKLGENARHGQARATEVSLSKVGQ